jgi:hypothetical protein
LMERKKVSEFNYRNSYINIRKVEGDSSKQASKFSSLKRFLADPLILIY